MGSVRTEACRGMSSADEPDALRDRCGCRVSKGVIAGRDVLNAGHGYVLGRSIWQVHRSLRSRLGDCDAQGRRLTGGNRETSCGVHVEELILHPGAEASWQN